MSDDKPTRKDERQRSFDLAEGERLKEEGMERAATKEARAELLERAREIAEEIGRERGQVSADDVYRRLVAEQLPIKLLGNAAGSIFKGDSFQPIGRKKSVRISNHARWIMVWKYVENSGAGV